MDDPPICAICFDEIEPTQQVEILDCLHWFHRDCSRRWINVNKTRKWYGYDFSCPVCRHVSSYVYHTPPPVQIVKKTLWTF